MKRALLLTALAAAAIITYRAWVDTSNDALWFYWQEAGEAHEC